MMGEQGLGSNAPPEASNLPPPEGLFFDELCKIRILDGDKFQATVELSEECKAFLDRAL